MKNKSVSCRNETKIIIDVICFYKKMKQIEMIDEAVFNYLKTLNKEDQITIIDLKNRIKDHEDGL